MKLDEFYNKNGRINLSIVNNGLQTGTRKPKFSLMIGFHIENNSDKRHKTIEIDNVLELIDDIGAEMNLAIDNFKINIDDPSQTIADHQFSSGTNKQTKIFTARHKVRWHRLLKNYKFVIRDYDKPLENSDGFTIYQRINDSLDKAIPLFSGELLEQMTEEKEHFTTIKNAFDNKEYGSKYNIQADNYILEREKLFDDISYQGQQDAFALKNEAKTKSKEKQNQKKDLLLLINSIYQHPEMARYYGLIYDFENVTEAFTAKYFNFVDRNEDQEILRKVYFTAAEPFNKYIVISNPTVSCFRSAQGKYYHGLKNFGCIKYDKNGFMFSNVSPDRKIQTTKLMVDTNRKNLKSNKLIQFSDIKRNVTEGIYLIQLPKGANDSKKIVDLNSVDNDQDSIGILGQNVVVIKDSHYYSLCCREVIYNPAGLGLNLHVKEEGWLHTNIAISGVNTSYNTQTIFHWTGHNLCVPRMGEHKDQEPDSVNEDAQYAGGVSGIIDNEENEIIKEYGYTYKYKLAKNTDTQLVNDTTHVFLIRQVLSNAYLIPINSDNAQEFTLEDLARDWPDYKFVSDKFSLNQEPINPPVLVPAKIFEGDKDKTTESASHLVVFNPGTIKIHLVFPSIIDMQFGQYLGMLSQDKLKPESISEYKARGRRIVKRVQYKIPSATRNDSVKYLPDIRGSFLVITPANWFTRWYLIREGAGANLALTCKEFFDFKKIEDNFPGLKARNLILRSAEKFKMTASKEGVLFDVVKGLQLKFYIQLQEEEQARVTSKAEIALASITRIVQSDFDNNKYAKGEFHLTHAVLKPEKPILEGSITNIRRPVKTVDINKVFYSFKLANKFPYMQTVKQLQIVSTFFVLNDDKVSIPNKDQITAGLKIWQANKKTGQLLSNEYPSDVLQNKIKQIETEVYRNNFGLKFKLTSTVKLTEIAQGDDLIVFNIGTNFTIKIKKWSVDKKTYYFLNDEPNPILNGSGPNPVVVDLTQPSAVYFAYTMADELMLTITDQNGVMIKSFAAGELLPYTDLSEKNASLSPNLELRLLADFNSDDNFGFVHDNDFFVYRAESKPSYINKTIQIQAVGLFPEFYPKSEPELLLSDLSDKQSVLIPNNVIPGLPEFKIMPLLFHTNSQSKVMVTKSRSMQLMFEIDRPLEMNETIALLILDNQEMSSLTCAIGRDLTTYSAKDFTVLNTKGDPLHEYIFTKENIGYLPKYLKTKKALINLAEPKISILPLIPYFEAKKNKWIVVVALDQERIATIAAYNPFVKIVAMVYNNQSTKGNFISKISPPKYINVLSQRVIKVSQTNGRQHWKVDIVNTAQVKFDNNLKTRSCFVVCLRERGYHTMNGGVVPSQGYTKDKINFHLLNSTNTINITIQRNKIVCVYEFETFANNQIDVNNVDWLNNSQARMIYAEEFE